MTRFLAFMSAVLLTVILLLLAVPALIWPEEIIAAVSEQVEEITGAPLDIKGSAGISIWPEPRVEIADVAFKGATTLDETPLFEADRLTGVLRLAPLLVGRIELSAVILDRPRLKVHTDRFGDRNWAIYARDSFDAVSVANPRIGVITIRDGSIEITDPRLGIDTSVTDIDGRIDWPRFTSTVEISGSGIHRAADIVLEASVERPVDLLFGGSTSGAVSFSAPSISGSATGTVGAGLEAGYDGTIDVSIGDLSAFSSWTRLALPVQYLPRSFAVSGTVAARTGYMSMNNAAFTLDGQQADGAISLTLEEEEPVIAGTLAFDRLELDPVIARLAAPGLLSRTGATDTQTGTPAEPLTVAGLLGSRADFMVPEAVSADLRISALRTAVAGFEIADTAATLVVRDGRADLGIGTASLLGGAVSGSLAATRGTDGIPNLSMVLSLDAVPLQPLLGERLNMTWISGLTQSAFDLTSRGETWRELLSALTGTARLAVSEGQLALPSAAEVDVTGLPGIAGDLARDRLSGRDARLSVATARLQLDAADGVVTLRDSAVFAAELSAQAEGTVSLVNGEVDIDVAVQQRPEPGAEADRPAPVPLEIKGRIDRPVLTIDPQAARRLIADR